MLWIVTPLFHNLPFCFMICSYKVNIKVPFYYAMFLSILLKSPSSTTQCLLPTNPSTMPYCVLIHVSSQSIHEKKVPDEPLEPNTMLPFHHSMKTKGLVVEIIDYGQERKKRAIHYTMRHDRQSCFTRSICEYGLEFQFIAWNDNMKA